MSQQQQQQPAVALPALQEPPVDIGGGTDDELADGFDSATGAPQPERLLDGDYFKQFEDDFDERDMKLDSPPS